MPSKQAVFTDNAPPGLPGLYNQAIVANGTVYCSGTIGLDPSTGKLVEGDVQTRTVGPS
jgi:enamine deaminase RidA (YjgF/YER057c/UK114 family)